MPRALILTALAVEYLAVRSYLIEPQETMHPSGTIYELGKFITDKQVWEVIIAEIGIGNAAAAVETERAVAFFNPEILMLVGIAGGIKDVQNGDVVVATRVYAYESGKLEEEFRPRPQTAASSHKLLQRAKAEARKPDWLQRLSLVPSPQPSVFIAPIASGDKVIASTKSETFRLLRSNYSDVVAVDREAFGVLSAASQNRDVETLVIRGISDLIGSKFQELQDSPQEKVAEHASAFAFQVLANIRQEKSDTEFRAFSDRSLPFNLEKASFRKGCHPVGQSISLSRYFDIHKACLKADEYAEALATVFDNAKGEVCFAVFGHWGRGKTYLMKLVEDKLSKGQYECVWFSAWKYRTKPEIWIHLYETLRLRATNGDNLLTNITRNFRIFLVKNGPGIIFPFIILLTLSLIIPLGVFGLIVIPAILMLGVAYSARLGMSLLGTWRNLSMLTGLSKKSFRIAEHQEKLGLQEVIGEDLRGLLIGWVGFGRNSKRVKGNIIKFWKKSYLLIYIILVAALSISIHSSIWATNSQLSQLIEFIGTFPSNTLYGDEFEALLKVIQPTLEKLLSGFIVSDFIRIFFPGFIFIIFLSPLLCLTRIGLKKSKVLLIVDDLDRLPSNEILEIIESLKLLLEGEINELIQVVVICEERFLEKAFCEKYDGPYDIENLNERKNLIEENIQKLFISYLRLPPISIDEQKEFISNLINYEPLNNLDDSGNESSGSSLPRSSEANDPIHLEYDGNMKSKNLGGTLSEWLISFLRVLRNSVFRYKLAGPFLKMDNKADDESFFPSSTNSRDKSKPLGNPDTRENESSSQSFEANVSEDLEYDEKVALHDSLDKLSEWVTLGPRALQSFVFRYKLARQLLKARGRKNIDASELAQLLAMRLSGQLSSEAVIDEDIKNVLEEVA